MTFGQQFYCMIKAFKQKINVNFGTGQLWLSLLSKSGTKHREC